MADPIEVFGTLNNCGLLETGMGFSLQCEDDPECTMMVTGISIEEMRSVARHFGQRIKITVAVTPAEKDGK